MASTRRLVIVADDYGIGPATSAGILRLCRAGAVSGTVLLVNSPYAEDAVNAWQAAAVSADLGWHPCLTIDAPVCAAAEVPTLTTRSGRFPSLGRMMAKLIVGRVKPSEVYLEFAAQLERFREMTGHWPAVVNSHHHIQVFPIVGAALRAVLRDVGIRPYLRRIREPLPALRRVAGARIKRTFLSSLGRAEARRQAADGFPGNDWLAGITNPSNVHAPGFFGHWLKAMPREFIELTCHPGDRDDTLVGRDAVAGDGNIERRIRELAALSEPEFRAALAQGGFQLLRPSECIGRSASRIAA